MPRPNPKSVRKPAEGAEPEEHVPSVEEIVAAAMGAEDFRRATRPTQADAFVMRAARVWVAVLVVVVGAGALLAFSGGAGPQ